jgi:hypothetical protein
LDHDEHLAQHDAQLQHLVALNVKMVDAIARIDVTLERLTTTLEVVTALLQRQQGDDPRHGGSHA